MINDLWITAQSLDNDKIEVICNYDYPKIRKDLSLLSVTKLKLEE